MLPCLQTTLKSELPTEIVCLPPIRPTYEEHLKRKVRSQLRPENFFLQRSQTLLRLTKTVLKQKQSRNYNNEAIIFRE